MMRRLLPAASLIATALLASPAPAALIIDREPHLTWDDLLACELVVVAHYESHAVGTVSVKVDRVLKTPPGIGEGGPVKVGDVIEIGLEHWWSVEVGPVGFDAMTAEKKHDGQPRLCYKQQVMNPGPLVPIPILDKTQPGVFFLPKREGALRAPNQVMPAAHADGWQQALAKKPMDLTFRLAQNVNPKLAADALAELKTKRDKKTIAALIDDVAASDAPRFTTLFLNTSAHEILTQLGDKDGDVYAAAEARIPDALKRTPSYAAYRLAEVMAAADPARAVRQCKAWLEKPPAPAYRPIAACALRFTGSVDGLTLALDLLSDKDQEVVGCALLSARDLAGNRSHPGPKYTPAQVDAFRAAARKRLDGAPPPAGLSQSNVDMYRGLLSEIGAEPR